MNPMEDQQAPQSEGEAKVITLCGSTKFEFAVVNQRLTMEGCVVIGLGMFSLPDLPDYDWTADSSDLTGGGSAACTSKRLAWLTRCTSWIRAAT
jgi:hypothetical protein